jgi:hypothetical protein
MHKLLARVYSLTSALRGFVVRDLGSFRAYFPNLDQIPMDEYQYDVNFDEFRVVVEGVCIYIKCSLLI